jgi:hypothetical protein
VTADRAYSERLRAERHGWSRLVQGAAFPDITNTLASSIACATAAGRLLFRAVVASSGRVSAVNGMLAAKYDGFSMLMQQIEDIDRDHMTAVPVLSHRGR